MAEVVRIALALGLAVGFAEVAVHAVRRFALGRLIWLGPDFWWMTPASYLLLFGVAAIPLLVVARLRPEAAPRLAVAAFAFVGTFALLWHVKGVHLLAWAAVAGGVAVQAGRLAGRRPGAVSRVARRLTRVLGGAFVATLVLGLALPPLSTRRAHRSLPPAATGAPDIVLVILDTVRAMQLDLYGYPRPTSPHLSALARDAVVFERAMSPSPSSLPGHAALLTGRLPHQIRADWRRPLEADVPTLAEGLADLGYTTAAVSGNLFYFTREAGLARGFHRFDGYGRSPGQVVRSSALGQFVLQTWASLQSGGGFQAPVGWVTQGRPAPRVLDRAERLARTRPDRPLFLAVNFLDAHRPYRPPEPYASRFLRGCVRTMTVPACVAQTRTDRYDAAVAHVDEALGALLERLEAAGIGRDAVVLVTSDHGEHLGERGLVGHGNSLYWPSLHVPLVLRMPGGPAGARVEAPVSLADVPATLLDLAGGGEGEVGGRSLARFWTGDGEPPAGDTLVASARASLNRPDIEPLSRGDMAAVLAWPVHYIRNGDGSEELYNVATDPLSTRNLMASPLGAGMSGPYRAFLERALETPPGS